MWGVELPGGELHSMLYSCVLCLVLKRTWYVWEKGVHNDVLGGCLWGVIDDVLKGALLMAFLKILGIQWSFFLSFVSRFYPILVMW